MQATIQNIQSGELIAPLINIFLLFYDYLQQSFCDKRRMFCCILVYCKEYLRTNLWNTLECQYSQKLSSLLNQWNYKIYSCKKQHSFTTCYFTLWNKHIFIICTILPCCHLSTQCLSHNQHFTNTKRNLLTRLQKVLVFFSRMSAFCVFLYRMVTTELAKKSCLPY